MTENKEIIIDGVDVSGCEYVEDVLPTADCKNECGFCYEFPNCYYKQFKRSEQKLKIATEALKRIKEYPTTDVYKNALIALEQIEKKGGKDV